MFWLSIKSIVYQILSSQLLFGSGFARLGGTTEENLFVAELFAADVFFFSPLNKGGRGGSAASGMNKVFECFYIRPYAL
jgi:hypothetical protein